MRTPGTGRTRHAIRRAWARLCLSAVAGLGCAVLVLPSTGAAADPSPSPSPSPSTAAGPRSAPGPTSTSGGGAPDAAGNGGPLQSAVIEGQIQDARKRAAAKTKQVQAIQAEYSVAAAKLQAVQNAAETQAEKYNAAELLAQQRATSAAAAATRAAAAVQAATQAQYQVGALAAHSYINGGSLGDLAPFLTDGGPQEMLDKAAMLGTLSDIRSQGLQQAQAASAVAAVLQRQAAQAQAEQLAALQLATEAKASAQAAADEAALEAAAIKKRQDALMLQLATLQQTSLTLQQQHQAALVAESTRRIKAAALKAAALKLAELSGSGAAVGPVSKDPNGAVTTAGAAAAIAFARAQIGKPYLWGGAGPDQFDCSGLTMRAWQQGGVDLGHYTGWQYAQTTHVSIADRRPGDLIFYGPDVAGIHHVGLYIGGDTMIEAPHTGAQVRYGNIWRSDLIMTLARP